MDFADFEIKAEFSPIYLFEGDDAFLSAKAVEILKEKFVTSPELNYTVLPSEVAVGDLIPTLSAFPFMSRKRMVVIREFYPKVNDLKGELGEYLSNPSNETLFVILNVKKAETLKKFDKITLVSCGKPTTAYVINLIEKTVQNAGITITDGAKNLIAEYTLCDTSRVVGETEKLIAYCFDKKQISEEDVKSLVVKDNEYKIYEMTEAVAKKDFTSALSIIEEMVSSGEAPQKLMVSVYYYFRKLFFTAISNLSDGELADELGVKEYAVTKMRRQVKAFNVKGLKKAVDTLADYDYLPKSGEIAFDRAFTLAIFKMMV